MALESTRIFYGPALCLFLHVAIFLHTVKPPENSHNWKGKFQMGVVSVWRAGSLEWENICKKISLKLHLAAAMIRMSDVPSWQEVLAFSAALCVTCWWHGILILSDEEQSENCLSVCLTKLYCNIHSCFPRYKYSLSLVETGTYSQSFTSIVLPWIQCKLGKQYLLNKVTPPWESNPEPFSYPGNYGYHRSVCWVKKIYMWPFATNSK